MTEIKNYYTKKDLNKVYPVLKELRQSLNKEKFLKLYRKMEKQGYKFIGLEFNGQAICIAGYSINYNFYNEKYIFVYDLVTKNDEQSKGYGKSMLKHLHRIAKKITKRSICQGGIIISKSNYEKLQISRNGDKTYPDKSSCGAHSRWLETDGKRQRIITYPKGYEADHICYDGHSFYVIEGNI